MKKTLYAVGSFALPMVAMAAVTDVNGLFNLVRNVLNAVIPIIISLAIVVFIWGVFKYVASGDSEKKEEGRNLMIWGIIAIFVMVSVWGLVNILIQTFGFNNQNIQDSQIPNLPTTRSF